VIRINEALISQVSQKAKASPRLRMNHNFHTDLSDTLQRMLNAMEPGTYVRPHRHQDPDKREVFIIFRGAAVVIEFDDKGNITDHIVLDASKGNYAVEIAERTWHTIISLKKNSVLFEFKDGPYTAITDKDFAPWAPAEGQPGTAEFNIGLLKKLGLD
jgi:cupin fold WbuC family metalloprotein